MRIKQSLCIMLLILLILPLYGCGAKEGFYQCVNEEGTGGPGFSVFNTWLELDEKGNGSLCVSGTVTKIYWSEFGECQFTVTPVNSAEMYLGTFEDSGIALDCAGYRYFFEKAASSDARNISAVSSDARTISAASDQTDRQKQVSANSTVLENGPVVDNEADNEAVLEPIQGLSLEGAMERGGLFVKKEERFVPLPEPVIVQDGILNYDQPQDAVFQIGLAAESLEAIPRIGEMDDLVLFTDNSTHSVQLLSPAISTGYALPLVFSSGEFVDDGIAFFDNEAVRFVERFGELEAFRDYDWDGIEQFISDMNKGTCELLEFPVELSEAEESCFVDRYGDMASIFFYDEPTGVPLEYYLGSAHHSVTLPACVPFVRFDSCNSDITCDTQTTKNGYYVINLEGLERGLYSVQAFLSEDGLVYEYGGSSQFLFIIE